MSTAPRSIRIVGHLFWVFPAILLFLAGNQAYVAYGIQQTFERGVDASAEVLYLHQENRVDVTYDYVDLLVTMADGTTFTAEQLSLPHTLIQEMEGRERVDVRVDRDASQPVVITDLAETHMRIALMNAFISALAMLFFAAGIVAWNRYLVKIGDPAMRGVERDDAEHPAGQNMRAW